MTEFNYCPQCRAELVVTEGAGGESHPSCPKGHFTYYANPPAAASGVIEKDGKYLVLQNAHEPSKGQWEIVGGFIQAGEGAEEALVREAKEETNLDVEILSYIGSFASVYGETGIKTVSVAFHTKVTGGELRISPESSDHRWVGLNEFPPMAHRDNQEAVKAFIASQYA